MRYIETFINHPIYSIIIGVALLLSLDDFVLRFAIEDDKADRNNLIFETDKEKILKLAEEFDKN